MSKKVFIIAGEASGDLHGSNLVKALLESDASLTIKAYGGRKMEDAGAEIVRYYYDYAFMGFQEVASNIRKVLGNIKQTEKLILEDQPDVIVFIDFPGFNLRVAKHLKKQLPSTRFVYYIAPQVWAWKKNRVHDLDKYMDEICVILPFEKDFFAQYGYDVKYVGHPLLDEIKYDSSIKKKENLVAILPGSRKQEIEKMLPIFIEAAQRMPEKTFEISKMPDIPAAFYQSVLSDHQASNFKLSQRSTYELVQGAGAAIVTSGTATLETALLGTPQVVAYKTSTVSYSIAKRIVDIPYISLVNLIMDEEVVKELIQHECSSKNIAEEVQNLLSQKGQNMLDDYDRLRKKLGGPGASKNAAKVVLDQLKTSKR